MLKQLFIILVFSITTLTFSQENFIGNYEPFIALEYDVNEIYSNEFSIEGRINWYNKKDYNFKVKQIEIAHESSFKLNKQNKLALGIQYRFEENFGGSDENELRFTEEYKYQLEWQNTELENRLRVEQRFAGSSTSHRFRYKIGITKAITHRDDENGIYVMGDLETLLTLSKFSKPAYEQRIAAGIGWPLNDFTALELITEYRLDDFTQHLGHELFLVSGMIFKL